jgi:23S rRNA pseudouridine1911/1915/1917 synthase
VPFVLKKYSIKKKQKIQFVLINELGFSVSKSQKLLARGRVFDIHKNTIKNNDILKVDIIYISLFIAKSRGLKPIFEYNDFAIFDKPSGVMVYPISKDTQYSLLDEVYYHFGDEASLAHRLDKETSGLVLVAKNSKSKTILQSMFEQKQYIKQYKAIVQGELKSNIIINTSISKDMGNIGVKMRIDKNGKKAQTNISIISYDKNKNQTLVVAQPYTGRQHQIRVHLDSIGHSIIGDPIYGVDEDIANKYLNKLLLQEDRIKYTKANRLMLHSFYLEFVYNNEVYKFFSNQDIKI